jgi:hypothetical protein
MSFFADNANGQGGTTPTTLPGTKLADTGTLSATLATQSISFNQSGLFADPDLYSMSLGTSGTLTSGGSLVGRSQAIVTAQAVNEPGALSILGLGIIGTGIFLRRKRRQDHPSFSDLAVVNHLGEWNNSGQRGDGPRLVTFY